MNAVLQCTFGAAPSNLMVLPLNRVMIGKQVAANIMDHIPFLNILPFGVCNTPSNPMVAAATAAAMGVLTPMPCIPMTTSPWVVGAPTVPLGKQPILNTSAQCICTWGGVIKPTFQGQVTTMVPS